MKISKNWLKEFISTSLNSNEISDYLTDIGLEVEKIETKESVRGGLKNIFVGKILSCTSHPNADRLKLTRVDLGERGILQIVCGAKNVCEGQTVPIAVIGAEIHTSEGSFIIKKSKLRGEISEGMICAEDEIGLGNSHDGILVLPDEYQPGKPLQDYIKVHTDEILEIGLTPNRTDAMGHLGIARDLYACLKARGEEAQFTPELLKLNNNENDCPISVEIEDTQACPRYIGKVIKGIQVKPSPQWLQDKLRSIDLEPINNVVDITNYILHHYGQPMHAFDLASIKENKIIVGYAKNGEELTTLDESKIVLNGSELVIMDGTRSPLCLAGIMGGKDSGVSTSTKDIFLEAAYFNPVKIRKAAKRHGINSDSSFRFERGCDPEMTLPAMALAEKLLIEIANADQVSGHTEFYPTPVKPAEIQLKYHQIEKLLGIKIPSQKVNTILELLGFDILEASETELKILAPLYRADVTRPTDVIEEILRIYGYNEIKSPAKIQFTPAPSSSRKAYEIQQKQADFLKSRGFYEVLNLSMSRHQPDESSIEILNPLSSELKYMRRSLIEGMLHNLAFNTNRRREDLRLFEFGKIYSNDKRGYLERPQLALLMSGKSRPTDWQGRPIDSSFYELKSILEYLVGEGCDQKQMPENTSFTSYIDFISSENHLARLGIIHPKVLKPYDIENDVFFAEIYLDSLPSAKGFNFKKISKYNPMEKDLAFLVPEDMPYIELEKEIKNLDIAEVGKILLFDAYQGKNLPQGKKSYALRLQLIPGEEQITERRVADIFQQIQQKLSARGAILRDS